jgi:hypothetical protein
MSQARTQPLVVSLSISDDVYFVLFRLSSLKSLAALAQTSKAEHARYMRTLFLNTSQLLRCISMKMSVAEMTHFLMLHCEKILNLCEMRLQRHKSHDASLSQEDLIEFQAACVLYAWLIPIDKNPFANELMAIKNFLIAERYSDDVISSIHFLHLMHTSSLFCQHPHRNLNHDLALLLQGGTFYKNLTGIDFSNACLSVSAPYPGYDLRHSNFSGSHFFSTDFGNANVTKCVFGFNRSVVDCMIYNYYKNNIVLDVEYFHSFKPSNFQFSKSYLHDVLNLCAEGFLDSYKDDSCAWVMNDIGWEVWSSLLMGSLDLSAYNHLRQELFAKIQPKILEKLFVLTDSLARSGRYNEAEKILLYANEHRVFTSNLSPMSDYLKKARGALMARLFDVPLQPVTPLEKIAALRIQYQTARAACTAKCGI